MTGQDEVSSGELARRMNDVLREFGSLVDKVDRTYIRREYLDLYKTTIDGAVGSLTQAMAAKAGKDELPKMSDYVKKDVYDELKKDVDQLQENNRWLVRIVITFVILGVLGAVYTVGGGK